MHCQHNACKKTGFEGVRTMKFVLVDIFKNDDIAERTNTINEKMAAIIFKNENE